MISSGRAPVTALAAVAIVLAAGLGGFLVQRLMAPARSGLRPVAPVAAPESRQATARAPAADSAPVHLPDFSLPDTAGITHRLADWRGRSLAVNFWATWCEPCRREIPLLETLRRENAKNGFEVVGIAVDHPEPVGKLVKELGIEYPVLVGEKGGLEAVAAFGMDTVLPFTVFADTQGRIVTLKIGELHRDEATFILARLADISAGRLDVAAARQQIGAEIRRLAASRGQ